MKIELEVKIDGERFFYDSAETKTMLTRGPDGKLNSPDLHNAEIDYCRLTIMATKAEADFHKQFVFPCLLSSYKTNEKQKVCVSAKGDAQ